MSDERPRPVLLYDGDCRFCRFAARAIARLDRDERVALLPFDDPAAHDLLARVPEDVRTRSIHVVEPDGRVLSGDAALTWLIDRLAPVSGGVSRLLGRLYGPVARRRDRIGPHVPDGTAPRRYP